MIPVNEPLLDGNERTYLNECLDSGWISSEGPFVSRFEQAMAATTCRRHGIAVCNGTAALETAMASLELEPGDEVIIPTFTIISCAAAVIRRGCVPVLVDSDPVTWNMDVTQVEARITPRTKAIMAVHIYGLPVDLDPLLKLATRYGLKIIEDAAEMLGQTYRGRPCGSFGTISVLSFYPNKHVTTGEGGMLLTDDDQLAERSRSLRNLCFQPGKRFVHTEIGYNFRMSNLQAALGVAQLERLEESVLRKRHMGHRYTELLSTVDGLELMPCSTSFADNIYWVYGVVLKESIPLTAAEAIKKLGEYGIDCRPFFWPMHEQPIFQKMGLFRDEHYPVSERLARRGFYIPSGLALTDTQLEKSAAAVKRLLSEARHQS